jgi:2-octaprenyl-6-methoxyphenol hydroxylase
MNDVTIIGSGMVGMTLACALKASQAKIALVDAAPCHAMTPHRLIALNGASYHLFKNIGLGDVLTQYGTPIQKIHVSHRGHFGSVRLSAEEMGYSMIGCVIPEKYIVQGLSGLLSRSENITCYRPEKLTAIEQDHEKNSVTLFTDQRELHSKIVIGADGTHSTVRALLKIDITAHDYYQSALVAEVNLSRSHMNVAYERFQESGAIAMLPLLNNTAAMIWTAPNDHIESLKRLDDPLFLKELQDCFGYRLGRFQSISHRATYPLLMQSAVEQIKGRVLLLGNAAHTMHPIAAQGLNTALHETTQLIDYLISLPFFDDAFQHFSFNVSPVNFGSTVSHGLACLFSKKGWWLNPVRSVGMIGFDLCSFAKARFTQYAMGETK